MRNSTLALTFAHLFILLLATPGNLHAQEPDQSDADYVLTYWLANNSVRPSSPDWRIDLSSPFDHSEAAKTDCKICHVEQPTGEQAALAWAYAYAQDAQAQPVIAGQNVGQYVVSNLVDDILRGHLSLDAQPVLAVLSANTVQSESTASLQRGDLIVAVQELKLTDAVAFAEQCESLDQDKIELTIIRAGKSQEITVPMDELQSPKPPFQFGVQVEDASEVLRTQLGLYENEGVVVTQVVEGSAAEEAGVQIHDILLRANDSRLSTLGDLREAAQASKGTALTLVLIRGGKEQPVQIQPKRAELADFSSPCPAISPPQLESWHHAYTFDADSTHSNQAYMNSLYGTVKAALESKEENPEETNPDQPKSTEAP